MSGPYTTITVDQFNRMTATIAAADNLARGAKKFREILPCYSQGQSVLAEEDVQVLEAALHEALAAYESTRARHGPGRTL